ncbi:hypothetical protein LCGC14_1526370 [marine sediment metagenome]|uniref:Uncharacterized protein n=2 Tax=root TaxID=1 RepID=A0A831VTW2_9FLAO|nr:hypothetical protein [Pricia antarctica]
MKNMQSLHGIIESLPQEFTQEILNCDSVVRLMEIRWETTDPDKIAVIDARIENINYLVS